jgi:signal transduction histidine kinase
MNDIVGFSSFLLEKDFSSEDKELYVKTTIRNAKHLLKLINDIIDISKVDAGEVNISKSETNINELCKEMHHLFKGHLISSEKNNIELKLEIPNTQIVIQTDETRLRQI